MTCSLCPKTALYIAFKRYYCKDHRADAVARSSSLQKESQSRKLAEGYYYEMRDLHSVNGVRSRF